MHNTFSLLGDRLSRNFKNSRLWLRGLVLQKRGVPSIRVKRECAKIKPLPLHAIGGLTSSGPRFPCLFGTVHPA